MFRGATFVVVTALSKMPSSETKARLKSRLRHAYASALPLPVYESSFWTSKEVYESSHNPGEEGFIAPRQGQNSCVARHWLSLAHQSWNVGCITPLYITLTS